MLEKLLEIDRDLFVWLNSLGSETFDPFWEFITKQLNWIPVFAIILYLTFKRLGWRHAVLIILIIAALITLTDQTTNLFKKGFERLRPGNDPEIAGFIRAVQTRNSFSFISGHASNSMAVAFFFIPCAAAVSQVHGLHIFMATYICLQPYLSWAALSRRYTYWLLVGNFNGMYNALGVSYSSG
nr:phosphatase PAP2 family protein [Flavobacterium sp. J372]